jgi:outer membrane protein assembly factor BamB
VAYVRSATGRVTAHEVDDGALIWECALGPGVRAGRPYSRLPGGTRAPLVVIADRLWTTLFDAVVALDLATGTVVQRRDVGSEIATLVPIDGAIAAVTADARVVPVRAV